MGFNPTTLHNLFLILAAWGGAFVAAMWLAAVFWTYRDMRARGRDSLAPILAALLVAVLSFPGLLIYLILRPPRTLEEEYQRALEEEALLETLEESERCPGCGRKVQPDWIVCPYCHTKLKKVCHHCGKLMALSWNICPYCGTPTPGVRKEGVTLDEAITSPTVSDEKAQG